METLVYLTLAIGTAFGGVNVIRQKNAGPALVLQKFDVHRGSRGDCDPVMHFSGRAAGFMAFLLTILRVSPRMSMTIDEDQIELERSSLFGQQLVYLPFDHIAAIEGGARRFPVLLLVGIPLAIVSLIALVGSFMGGGSLVVSLIMLLAAAALIAWYVFYQQIYISVHTDGDSSFMIRFGPNLIEGVRIDLERTMDAVRVLRDLVLKQSDPTLLPVKGKARSSRSAAPAPFDETSHNESPFDDDEVEFIDEPDEFDFVDEPEASPQPVPSGSRPVELMTEEERTANAARMFAKVEQLVKERQREPAVNLLNEIVRLYPTTPAGRRAAKTLKNN